MDLRFGMRSVQLGGVASFAMIVKGVADLTSSKTFDFDAEKLSTSAKNKQNKFIFETKSKKRSFTHLDVKFIDENRRIFI